MFLINSRPLRFCSTLLRVHVLPKVPWEFAEFLMFDFSLALVDCYLLTCVGSQCGRRKAISCHKDLLGTFSFGDSKKLFLRCYNFFFPHRRFLSEPFLGTTNSLGNTRAKKPLRIRPCPFFKTVCATRADIVTRDLFQISFEIYGELLYARIPFFQRRKIRIGGEFSLVYRSEEFLRFSKRKILSSIYAFNTRWLLLSLQKEN